MSFSERAGIIKPKYGELGSINDNLKNDIWTLMYKIINSNISIGTGGYNGSEYHKKDIAESLWTDFFNKNIIKLPPAEDYVKEIDKLYQGLEWNKVLDLIEYLLIKQDSTLQKNALSQEFNEKFKKHDSPYRIINNIVQPVSDGETIKYMEEAIENSPNSIVKNHLEEAQRLYSNRKATARSFSGSSLESIHAVEASCHIIFNNTAQLSDNIKNFTKDGKMNKHVIKILDKINQFRGDVAAHADKENGYNCSLEDAILLHSVCCGFVNYLKMYSSGRN